METKTFVIEHPVGLHARPAALFVQAEILALLLSWIQVNVLYPLIAMVTKMELLLLIPVAFVQKEIPVLHPSLIQ